MMRRHTLYLFLALVAAGLLIAGCGDKAKPDAGESGDGGSQSAKTDGAQPKPEPTEEKKALDLSALPANLKNEAFEYYGLAAGKVDLEITRSTQAEPMSGSQTATLTEVRDGEALFTVERTGPLATQGNQELVLRENGIYATKFGENVLDPPQLELPSPATPGRSWTTNVKLTIPTGQSVSENARYRIVRTEKVKTRLGELEALRVEGTGTTTVGDDSFKVSIVGWYVKGRGPVKIELKSTKKGGETETFRIEMTK